MMVAYFKVGAQKALFGLLVLLFVVWPVPGTIALRYVILSLLLCVTIYFMAGTNYKNMELRHSKGVFWAPLCLLALLSIWILVSFVCLSVDKSTVKAEILGQWVPAVACFALGGGLAYVAIGLQKEKKISSSQRLVIYPIFLGTGILVGFSVLIDFVYYVVSGKAPYIVGSSAFAPQVIYENIVQGFSLQDSIVGESPDRFSMVVFIYISIMFAEILSRVKSIRIIQVSNGYLFLLFVVGLCAHYFVRNRNGNVVFLLEMAMVLMCFYYLCRDRFSKAAAFYIAILSSAILAASGMLFFKADQRWNELLETLPIALDTKDNTVWLTRDAKTYPSLEDGRVVDNSNYDRVAWAKEGVLLVIDQPLGTGFNRNAFGDGVDTKYERNGLSRGGHSHSGLIDFTIANGLPGLVLWIGFIFSMVGIGVVNLTYGKLWSGIFLMVYPPSYLIRSLLDSVIRDNYLQQFMFVVGLVWVWSSCREKRSS